MILDAKDEPIDSIDIGVDDHFIFFKETPLNHWYPGAGIGISYKEK